MTEDSDGDKSKEARDAEVIQELRAQLNNFRLLTAFVVALVVGTAVFYHWQEGWSWLNSFYFTIVTLGTVGYGDLTPSTSLGKLYAMVLIVVGIATFGFFAQQLIKRQQLRGLERQMRQLENGNSKNRFSDSIGKLKNRR